MKKYTSADLAPIRLPVADVDGDGVIRVACVGDSITAGMPDSNYPAFLQEYLNVLGKQDGNTYEVCNHGKGGAAVRHYLENIGTVSWENVTDEDGDGKAYFYYDDVRYTSSLTYTPDVVLVQFGTNDGAGGNLPIVDSYFKTDYYEYLIKPYQDKGSYVVLATPPHASNGIHDEGVNGRIRQLVREIAAERNLPLIDVNKLTEGRDESFPDGLHGNDSGYSLLAQLYFNKVFGGERVCVGVHSNPGAMICFDLHNAVADEKGDCFVTLPAYQQGREVAIKAVCDGFRTVEKKEVARANEIYECVLTQRQYNLAVGCTATADSFIGDNCPALAVDGDKKSRWESEYRDGCWLMVDLGESKTFSAVNVFWEGAYANHYTIDVSKDGEAFTTVADVTIGRGGLESTLLCETKARFVRINCLTRGTWFGNSIHELQILTEKAD